jgi:hypothetical protein
MLFPAFPFGLQGFRLPEDFPTKILHALLASPT